MANETHKVRPMEELDKKSRERLTALLSVESAAVSYEDRKFLYGRRDYLTTDQIKEYGLESKPEAPTTSGGDDTYSVEGLEDKSVKELRAQAKKLEISQAGTKDELVARIREYIEEGEV